MSFGADGAAPPSPVRASNSGSRNHPPSAEPTPSWRARLRPSRPFHGPDERAVPCPSALTEQRPPARFELPVEKSSRPHPGGPLSEWTGRARRLSFGADGAAPPSPVEKSEIPSLCHELRPSRPFHGPDPPAMSWRARLRLPFRPAFHGPCASLAALAVLAWWSVLASLGAPARPRESVVDLGTRLELFADGRLVERLEGASLRLHAPQPVGEALRFDAPWEGELFRFPGTSPCCGTDRGIGCITAACPRRGRTVRRTR
jgi:hypothetical protein